MDELGDLAQTKGTLAVKTWDRTDITHDKSLMVLFGGLKREHQINQQKRDAQVCLAPGRLEEHPKSGRVAVPDTPTW